MTAQELIERTIYKQYQQQASVIVSQGRGFDRRLRPDDEVPEASPDLDIYISISDLL